MAIRILAWRQLAEFRLAEVGSCLFTNLILMTINMILAFSYQLDRGNPLVRKQIRRCKLDSVPMSARSSKVSRDHLNTAKSSLTRDVAARGIILVLIFTTIALILHTRLKYEGT